MAAAIRAETPRETEPDLVLSSSAFLAASTSGHLTLTVSLSVAQLDFYPQLKTSGSVPPFAVSHDFMQVNSLSASSLSLHTLSG